MDSINRSQGNDHLKTYTANIKEHTTKRGVGKKERKKERRIQKNGKSAFEPRASPGIEVENQPGRFYEFELIGHSGITFRHEGVPSCRPNHLPCVQAYEPAEEQAVIGIYEALLVASQTSCLVQEAPLASWPMSNEEIHYEQTGNSSLGPM
jgi:hypothetical protein